jgi:hypothetical protein
MDFDERETCPWWFPIFLLGIGLITATARHVLM